MRKIQCVLFLAAILMPVSARAEQPDEWFKCQADTECVVINGLCGFDWAVNSEYLSQANKVVAQGTSCLKTGAHNPHALANCVDGKCMVFVPNPATGTTTGASKQVP